MKKKNNQIAPLDIGQKKSLTLRHLYLTDEQWTVAEKIATEKDVSIAEVIRIALNKGLKIKK